MEWDQRFFLVKPHPVAVNAVLRAELQRCNVTAKKAVEESDFNYTGTSW